MSCSDAKNQSVMFYYNVLLKSLLRWSSVKIYLGDYSLESDFYVYDSFDCFITFNSVFMKGV